LALSRAQEIDRLKGIPRRPQRQASSLEQPTPPDKAAQKKAKKEKRPRRSGKRKKTAQLRIDEIIPCTPPKLPEGSRRVGHKDFVVQDLLIRSRNVCYRREEYQLPDGSRVMYHDLYVDQPMISDDAGQFKILGYAHGLCWLHAERGVAGLVPLSARQHRVLDRVCGQIWRYYQRLKAYRQRPTSQKEARLHRDFDRLFLQRTGWVELNEALTRLHAKKEQLLLVLERPELPLHNNLAERDIREWAKKRKISAGTRSDLGRRCRDTFLSLKKTCRKLGVSFWRYLTDRVAQLGEILPLPDLIRQAAPPDTAAPP
jgi:hypothetical protein